MKTLKTVVIMFMLVGCGYAGELPDVKLSNGKWTLPKDIGNNVVKVRKNKLYFKGNGWRYLTAKMEIPASLLKQKWLYFAADFQFKGIKPKKEAYFAPKLKIYNESEEKSFAKNIKATANTTEFTQAKTYFVKWKLPAGDASGKAIIEIGFQQLEGEVVVSNPRLSYSAP